MSLILRRISRTADGRDIVRDTPLNADRITIGRAAENIIHLEDLALNPHHAVLEPSGDRRVRISASEGLGFTHDGRQVTHAELESGELGFGSHRITVGREGDAIVLTVERVEALSEASKDRDEMQAFSLAGVMPGKRLGAWAFIALVLLAFLIAPIWAWHSFRGVEERPDAYHADMSWSSGKLSKAHHALEKDCQSCHVEPFVAVRDTACVACHNEPHNFVHANAKPADLLAAKAPPGWGDRVLARFGDGFNKPPGRCVECHTEHEGAGDMPPTAQQFCSDCHDGMSGRIKTTLADAADFGTDHPQFRPLVMTRPPGFGDVKPVMARISLDKKPADLNGLKFPHDVHLLANGGVARMAVSQGGKALQCGDCHIATPDRVGFKPVDMESQCASCHSLSFEQVGGVTRTLRHGEPAQVIADLTAYYRSTPPSRPVELGGMARRRPGNYAAGQVYNIYFREVAVRPSRASEAVAAVFSKGGACYDCHTIAPPASGNNWRVMPVHQTARFMQKGWFDHDAHKQEKCSDCHAASKSGSASDLLLPDLKSCRTCHGGEASRADVPSSCAMCHDYHADDKAPRGSIAGHGKTVSGITGRARTNLYTGLSPARRSGG